MDLFMIFSAKYVVYLMIVIALGFAFSKKDQWKKVAIISGSGLVLSFLVAKIAGMLYYHPRPFVSSNFKPLIEHAANNGFPSDHSLLVFSLASIVFLFNKKLGIVLGLLGLLVGYARIYVGVHSPLDILGSFVISIVSVFIAKQIYGYTTTSEKS